MILDLVESLRKQMVQSAVLHHSLTHPDVLRLSQQLDQVILSFQKEHAPHLGGEHLPSTDMAGAPFDTHRPTHRV
ncbi:aspartyl-phosphate phosphatase Spo0E family protein [Alicyclobacillus sp.]|uniref:aspartyl-phosphate phosphatase Spo0E family protein n=1 Tax=Alicyclobacillus sp. TaxID=61169 RepID=UPI0025C153E1|nr:aspartyl-phosphate phosphatase Spo0E family protein [Alicyclobacillus sp.]MCL6517043.1 aspartyl-phosphate phosphatase Spo0E family protein [Alicyclobacillus sp.]